MNLMNFALAHVMGQRYDRIDSSDQSRADVVAAMLPNPFFGIIAAKSMLDRAQDNATPPPVQDGGGGKGDGGGKPPAGDDPFKAQRALIQAETTLENRMLDVRAAVVAALNEARAAGVSTEDLVKELEQLETDIDNTRIAAEGAAAKAN